MGSSRSSGPSREAVTRFGSETPRVFSPPLRRLTPKTTLGFALIEFADEVVGIPLLPWQRWLAVHALELLPDGTFRFRNVVLLVARQNGKSTFLQILALFFLYVRGVTLVIGTAQKLDLAEEVWQGAVDIAEGVPELAAEIDHVTRVNGKKALELRKGERYKVEAANRKGGRGLSGDLVMLDELREHKNWEAWSAVTKTTMARPLAQVWAVSNAGDGQSVVLAHLRSLAHVLLGDPDGAYKDSPLDATVEGVDSLGIFEWSAAPGRDVSDLDGWAEANPSLGYTITERVIRSSVALDPEPVTRTEVLCQWVDDMRETVLPMGFWMACADSSSRFMGAPVFALDVTPDRSRCSIAAAGVRSDGLPHVEVMENRAGTGWVPTRLAELVEKWRPAKVLADPAGPAGSLIGEAATVGVEVEAVSVREHAAACGLFYDLVVEGRMRHLGDPLLETALLGATRREVGDAWLWSRKHSLVDVSPLVASTLALWAVGDAPPAPLMVMMLGGS